MLDYNEIKGVIPPIVTPVDENENVDAAGLKRVIDHVLNGGVHGVFVLGSNGEFYGLDFENQKRALEAQYKLIPLRNTYNYGSFPVVMKDCLNLMGLNVGHPVKPIDHCTEERLSTLKKVLSDLNLL